MGLGTFGMGGGMVKDTNHDKDDIEAIQYAIKLGMTHIDTAEMYAQGHSEELVGQAIKNFPRKNIFLTTKVHPSHLRHDDVLAACHNSLRRLQTDYIDLYLIHWPNPDIPLAESLKAMDKLVQQGLTKAIGVSNFDVDLLKEAQNLSQNKIVADQVEYSLVNREPEEELLPYCQKNNILLTAYTPLKGVVRNVPKIVEEIAQKHNKTPAQIALNYLISQNNVIAIPMSGKKEHIKDNAGAVGWKLEPEDIVKLRQKP